jgi:hypothetical protein
VVALLLAVRIPAVRKTINNVQRQLKTRRGANGG